MSTHQWLPHISGTYKSLCWFPSSNQIPTENVPFLSINIKKKDSLQVFESVYVVYVLDCLQSLSWPLFPCLLVHCFVEKDDSFRLNSSTAIPQRHKTERSVSPHSVCKYNFSKCVYRWRLLIAKPIPLAIFSPTGCLSSFVQTQNFLEEMHVAC